MDRRRLRGPAVLSLTLVSLLGWPQLSFPQQPKQASAMERFKKFPETPPVPGDTAPDFTLKTLSGEEFTLSRAHSVRPVVIEFGSFT